MKIWIVNQYVIPPTQSGGTRHYSLARELLNQGHEVYIVGASFDHATRTERRLAPGEAYKIEKIDGITFLWLRTPAYKGNTVGRMWNMLVFAAKVWFGNAVRQLPAPDVVIGSSPHLFAAFAAERLAARHRVPFLTEVRDLWPQSLIDLGSVSPGHPLVRLLGWIERYLYRKSDVVLTLLPASVDYIASRGGNRERIVWLPNGVDFALVPPVTLRDENEPVFTVLYAGAHGLANALDPVLDAAALLQKEGAVKPIRFRFVGDGPEKARLQQRVVDEGIENVVFEPPVAKQEIFRVMQEADAFIVNTSNTGLYKYGTSINKLYDYLASARPVVFAVDSSYNPVTEAQAGLNPVPSDVPALAASIRELASLSQEERQAMGLRGRAYVQQFHSYASLGKKLGQVLTDVVGNS